MSEIIVECTVPGLRIHASAKRLPQIKSLLEKVSPKLSFKWKESVSDVGGMKAADVEVSEPGDDEINALIVGWAKQMAGRSFRQSSVPVNRSILHGLPD